MRIKPLWIALVVGALLVARLLGDGVIEWHKGGDHGIVNLPCFASASSNRNVAYSRSCVSSSCKTAQPNSLGFRMKDIELGAKLILPSRVSSCIVQFKTQGLTIGFTAVKGSIHIEGRDLVMLRDNDVLGFELRLIDGEQNYLDVEFELPSSSQGYQIIVR